MSPARTRGLVGLAVLAVYAVTSRVVGDVYPFSTFPMYAGHRMTTASRVAVRDAKGTLCEVTDFTAFSCPSPVDVGYGACPGVEPFYYIPYIDRDASTYVTSHAGQADEEVSLVRHIWRFGEAGIREEDCVLQRCRARRR